ncbi:serine/threonine protein phosphatase [Luteimonas sp. BDR2-5]|uniref:serine/threonine protein phosphatase n=1 Tax=Proluteimonas luteida TaxID=2878685 RepID=UPI001E401F90|nr:serine/threonine protein phosphatase [Luteimonas sp. BDR2-5]MCD9028404.1 serine/threonine protein phosphatase [Luteimonas sp. BDR2-5]
MGVETIVVAGHDAWLKAYDRAGSRRLSLGVLDAIARGLQLDALRPPPHPGGGEARRIEARRLAELEALGVRVPRVIGEGESTLLLSDIGMTMAARLRAADGDADAIDALTTRVIAAIADAHARGAYLGQAIPRNIAIDDAGNVGFLDFEEDPLEVMSLPQAQARDWLLFAFGVAKYYDGRTDALAGMLARGLHAEPDEVVHQAQRVERLQGFAQRIRWLGRSARQLAHSILVVRAATLLPVLVVVALLADWLEDGEIELLQMLF